jgi:alpha-L-rhamnosidase
MNRLKLICYLVVFQYISLYSYAQKNAPGGLLCDLLSHPEWSAITNRTPDFGWVVNSDISGDYQTAYQIMVASSPGLLSSEQADLWDSCKITVSQSINVEYAGKPLSPHQSYWWKVRTWGKTDVCSEWSAPQHFITSGFDEPKNWLGESRWVKLTDEAGNQFWTMENRHPIRFHDVETIRTIVRKNEVVFYDFKKSAFAYLTFNITWTPENKK